MDVGMDAGRVTDVDSRINVSIMNNVGRGKDVVRRMGVGRGKSVDRGPLLEELKKVGEYMWEEGCRGNDVSRGMDVGR